MTKPEKELNETNAPIGIFDGYGLENFRPVYVTIDQVARLIRWQCQYMFDGWDMEEFNSLCYYAKKRFLIIGD